MSGGRVFERPVGSPISAVNDADHVDDAVAEILEVLHLADEHGVAEVEIGRRRDRSRP